MSSPSKQKGMAAERKVLAILQAHGIYAVRHLSSTQAQGGGCDIETDQFAIECKYRGRGQPTSFEAGWFLQAGNAASELGKRPCVVYKFAGREWRARFRMLTGGPMDGQMVDVNFEDWVRRGMPVA